MIGDGGEEKGKGEGKKEEEEREIRGLGCEKCGLVEYKKKGDGEVCGVGEEEKILGKIDVKSEL